MEQDMSHTRGWYRINAIRNLSGATKLTPPINEKQAEVKQSFCVFSVVVGFFFGGGNLLFVFKVLL